MKENHTLEDGWQSVLHQIKVWRPTTWWEIGLVAGAGVGTLLFCGWLLSNIRITRRVVAKRQSTTKTSTVTKANAKSEISTPITLSPNEQMIKMMHELTEVTWWINVALTNKKEENNTNNNNKEEDQMWHQEMIKQLCCIEADILKNNKSTSTSTSKITNPQETQTLIQNIVDFAKSTDTQGTIYEMRVDGVQLDARREVYITCARLGLYRHHKQQNDVIDSQQTKHEDVIVLSKTSRDIYTNIICRRLDEMTTKEIVGACGVLEEMAMKRLLQLDALLIGPSGGGEGEGDGDHQQHQQHEELKKRRKMLVIAFQNLLQKVDTLHKNKQIIIN